MRLTGMASGLDTDAVIQNLGRVHTMRIDKVKQDKQILQWRQEMYRETITKLSTFMKSNLNVSNPLSNMRSSAAFAKFTYTVKGKIGGIDASELLSITANGDIKNFSQKIQAVAQLATKDKFDGFATDLQGINTKGLDYYNFGIKDSPLYINGGYDPNNIKYSVFGISIDGTTRTIKISPDELLQAYRRESGGMYSMVQNHPDAATIENDVIGDAINGTQNATGLFMHKSDGSIGALDFDEIYKWYQSQKGVDKFDNPDRPTDVEKMNAIISYFHTEAVYTKKPDYEELSAMDKSSLANIFIDTPDANMNTSSGTILVKDGGGNYSAVTMRSIYDRYASQHGLGSGWNPSTTDKDDPDRVAAITEYFTANDIYHKNSPKTSTALADLIDKKIIAQFGKDFAGIVTATPSGELNFKKAGSVITLFDEVGFDSVGKGMGLKGGASSAGAVTGKKLSEFLPGNLYESMMSVDGVELIINGVTVALNKDETIGSFMTKLNGSNAGVTISYTASKNSFTLESKLEGTANAINFSDMKTATFFGMGFGFDEESRSHAQNFVGIINGEEYIRQSNSFTHEGMTYTFNQTFNVDKENLYVKGSDVDFNDPDNPYVNTANVRYTIEDGYLIATDNNGHKTKVINKNAAGKIDLIDNDAAITATVNKNTDEIVKTIKNFVDEYNDMVTYINDLIKGKRVRKNGAIEYPPLSEEERKALSPEEAKLYDEKAKLGLMGNESDLRKVLNDLRTSLYQKVEGVGLTMADIGITTSVNYSDGGTLVVDENKLKAALDRDFDGVVSLFTKSSSIPSSEKDSKKLAQRAAESGIAQRLNDILTAAAGTSTGGDKGYLLKKAGMVNDRTQADNQMTKQLADYDKKIDALLERWYRQEQNYYAMFARMETAMSKLQAQQNSLAQIMAAGGGGGK